MKRRTLTTIAICLLAAALGAAVGVAAKSSPRTVPFDQCSEVYQRYHDFPGIRAAFIRDKQINDTLRLDMTLLQAEDSLAFANLMRNAGYSKEFVQDIMSFEADENTRFSGLRPKGKLTLPIDSIIENNDVMAVFPLKKAVAIFHTHNEEEIDVVLLNSYRKKIKID